MMCIENVELSLVVPVFNEEEVLGFFLKEVKPYIEKVTESYEILFINDGSTDNTWDRLRDYAEKDSRIKVINLSRNFGKEVALTAGMDHANGQTVIPIDCDLQDPPELICDMFEKWKEGYDVVLARRVNRSGDSFIKRWTSSSFYKLISNMSDVHIPANVGDFRLLDRKVLKYLRLYPERTRFMKGIFASLGFKTAIIDYVRPDRVAGNTKWSYIKLYKLALDGIISFSSFPLIVWSYVGAATAISAFIYGLFLIFRTVIRGVDVPGYASLMVVFLFMSGLILISLGVIGEYLARIFIEVKSRPMYIIMDKLGFDD